MLGNFGANSASANSSSEQSDARTAALQLMSEALARLDGDSNIPAVIGAHLQTAIDALWTNGSPDPRSNHLH